jgi:hypothetical protein
VWKVVYAVQIQRRDCRKLLTNALRQLYFPAESIPRCSDITFYQRANNRVKYGDGLYNSLIDDKDGHIPSPLIMVTCTALRHALLEWQKNRGVHLKASKSKLQAHRPDRSNYFNCKNDGGKNASCCPATGRKLLTLPSIADVYTILMNPWNTLLESYQQRVYNNTLASVKHQIQQVANPTPAVVISVNAAHVDNAILLEYLASEVALEEPEIRSTESNIPIDNNCTYDELHFVVPGGSRDYEDERDGTKVVDAIPTSSRRRRPVTELEMFDLGSSDVQGYEGRDGDDVNVDEGEGALQADDGSMQNLED